MKTNTLARGASEGKPRYSPRTARVTKACRRLSLEHLEQRTVLTAGTLDPTFGVDGFVFENGPSDLSGDFVIQTLVQEDGKILLLQQNFNGYIPSYSLTRYLSDGSRDALFGGEGRAVVDVLQPSAMVLQPDGRIVVAGYIPTQFGDNAAVACFHGDGSLDTAFGNSGGIALVDFDPPELVDAISSASSVAIQTDGKIVVAGTLRTLSSDIGDGIGVVDFAVARLNVDGTIDPSFSTDGKQVLDFDFANGRAESVAVQSDGTIVIGGSGFTVDATTSLASWGFAVARLTPDGSLDQTFGEAGKVAVDISSHSTLAVQEDGKIVLAGLTQAGYGVARLDQYGILDPDFGVAGRAVAELLGADWGESTGWFGRIPLAIQANGKIVLGGMLVNLDDFNSIFSFRSAIVRFNANGSRDLTFGAGGAVIGEVNPYSSSVESIALDQAGRIVVAGSVWRENTDFDAFVARYLNPDHAPTAPDDSFSTLEKASVSWILPADDIDDDPLTFVIIDPPLHGTLSGNVTNVTYTPHDKYNGPDSFTYKVSDGLLDSSPASVEIYVSPVNDLPAANLQDLELDEDETYSGLLTGDDGDPEIFQTLTFAVASEPVHGQLTLDANGLFSYEPDEDYHGPDSFTFTVTDDSSAGPSGPLSASAAVTLTINAVNDNPIASSESFTTDEDFALSDILTAHDGDPEVVQALTFVVMSGPEHGTLTFFDEATGVFTYQPEANYNGPDAFWFQVSDDDTAGSPGGLTSTLAMASINVNPINDLPFAGNDAGFVTPQDVPQNISFSTLLANDTDVDGDELTLIHYINPVYGSLTVNVNGSFTYLPGTAAAPVDSFTYIISDGNGGIAQGTVFIAITHYSGTTIADGVLRFGGTPDGDVVTVSSHDLVINGAAYSLTGISEVRIWAGDGNDQIDLSGLDISAFIVGGNGNDSLTGGKADDLIFGDAGTDEIAGGLGNDFLCGGLGSDFLLGNAGDDILAAGEVDASLGIAILRARSAAWVASQATILDPDGVKTNDDLVTDAALDQLTGVRGADWFLISLNDNITDLKKSKGALTTQFYGKDFVSVVS